jgi:hypothetical protein
MFDLQVNKHLGHFEDVGTSLKKFANYGMLNILGLLGYIADI